MEYAVGFNSFLAKLNAGFLIFTDSHIIFLKGEN